MCLFTFAMSVYHAINFTAKPVGLMLFVREKCEGIMLFYLVKLCDIVFIVNLWCLDQLTFFQIKVHTLYLNCYRTSGRL